MTPRRAAISGVLCLAGGLGLSAAVLRAGDAFDPLPAETGRLVYLRSGPIARRAALSFRAVTADAYWIRTIQHYGRDRKSTRMRGRFELLFPLLDVTTSLDPHFNVAYRLGAVFLAEPPPSGPGRVDQAVSLLEKGLRHDPARWQYAFDIGFIYYWYGTGAGRRAADCAQAADWFERSADMPRAPVWLRQLAAVTRTESGDTRSARALLMELAASDQDWVRRMAARGLDQLTAIDAIQALQRQVDRFVLEHQRAPASWADLHPDAPRSAVPIDPSGVPYEFDSATQHVMLSSTSPLFPLPRTPGAR